MIITLQYCSGVKRNASDLIHNNNDQCLTVHKTKMLPSLKKQPLACLDNLTTVSESESNT